MFGNRQQGFIRGTIKSWLSGIDARMRKTKDALVLGGHVVPSNSVVDLANPINAGLLAPGSTTMVPSSPVQVVQVSSTSSKSSKGHCPPVDKMAATATMFPDVATSAHI